MDTVLKVSNGFIDATTIFERFRCEKIGDMRAEPSSGPLKLYGIDYEKIEVEDNGKDG